VKSLTPAFDSLAQFTYGDRYFGDSMMISADFSIGEAESPPYFYFPSSLSTDLESVSRVAHVTLKISTKFEVDSTIRCPVLALWLLIRYVTL